MKNFKFSLAWLVMFALIFTSCSKEETDVMPNDQEKIQVTFRSLLADFNSQNKQAAEPGECREGDPAYVHVAITDSAGNYIGEDDGDMNPEVNFIEVDLKYNPNIGENGVWETMYTNDLALVEGEYVLQYFVVYDSEGEVLWVAPRSEGAYGSNVDNALPQDFFLESGSKPYITVDVLCYIPRNEEAYGYLFFDIQLTEIENNYCLFVNYCADDERDYPAYFSVDVWTEGYDSGIQVIDGAVNSIDTSGDWPAASVLCLPLPELMGDDTYYVTVTVLDHNGLPYNADETDVKQFEISQADIDAQLNDEPAYEHVRFECGEDTSGGDEDCAVETACELDVTGDLEDDFCNVTSIQASNSDGWVRVDSAEEFALVYTDDLGDEFQVGTVDVSVNGNAVTVVLDTPEDESDIINETDHFTAYAVEVRPSVGDMMSDDCWESQCANVIEEFGSISNTFDSLTYEYPVYVKVSTVSCFTPNQ